MAQKLPVRIRFGMCKFTYHLIFKTLLKPAFSSFVVPGGASQTNQPTQSATGRESLQTLDAITEEESEDSARQREAGQEASETISGRVASTADKIVVQPLYMLLSAVDKIAAVSHDIARKRLQTFRQGPGSAYSDNNDDEALETLLGNTNEQDDMYD